MLVSSSGKHTIPLSSRRQRNIPQGRTRGEFEIRPQETGQATSVHVLPCLSDSGLLTSALNSRHFSRKYTSVCLSVCPSLHAGPGERPHSPHSSPAVLLAFLSVCRGWCRGRLGLQILRVCQENLFVSQKRLIHYLLVFQIALGQGWVKQHGRNWEITPWPCPSRHKVLLKPGEAHTIGIPQDLGLYPFTIPNAAFSILSRPLPVA